MSLTRGSLTRGSLTRGSLTRAIVIAVLSAAPVALPGEDAVVWTFAEGAENRFRLDYEVSTRRDVLDPGGQPVKSWRGREDAERLDATLSWTWKRRQRTVRTAEVVIEKLHALKLPGWPGDALPEGAITATVRLRVDGPHAVEVTLRGADATRIARRTRRPEAVASLRRFLAEGITELTRLLPPEDEPVTRPGQKWTVERRHVLDGRVPLEATLELEYVEKVERPDDGPIARVEGSVRQAIPGAPAEVQREPGLFPGTITWVHDLAAGFPLSLELEKATRVPVAHERLPLVETIAHTQRLRVSRVD